MAALNWQQQRALMVMRSRLVLRQFMREPGQVVSVILVVALFVPLFLALAAGVGVAYYLAPTPWPELILALALLVAWGAWLLFPIFFNSLSDNFDLGRLTVYPIGRADLLASAVLGSFLDYPMFFLLPLSLAIAVSWGAGMQILLVGPALVVAYGLMLLSSQLVTLILGAILQSRRFRDAMILFFSVFGLACMFVNFAMEYLAEQLDLVLLQELVTAETIYRYVQWSPPGAVAQSIRLAEMGQWLPAGGWLLYAAAWLFVLARVWYLLVGRMLVGDGYLLQLGAAGGAEEKERPAREWFAWIPDDIRAVAAKEFKMVWRTPSRRISLFQGFIFPLVIFIPMATSGERSFSLPDWFGLGLLGYAAFNQWTVTLNMLGYEGRGLPTLMLMPFSRQRYLLGKALGLSLVSLPSVLIMTLLVMVLNPNWTALFSLLFMPAVVLPITAFALVTGVLVPTPINLEKVTSSPGMTRGGCLAGIVLGFVSPAVNLLLLGPIIGPLMLAYWRDWPWLPPLLLLPSYLFAGAIFYYAVRWSGRRMQDRAPEIIAQAALPEDK